MRRLSGVTNLTISEALEAGQCLRRWWAGYRLGLSSRQHGFSIFCSFFEKISKPVADAFPTKASAIL